VLRTWFPFVCACSLVPALAGCSTGQLTLSPAPTGTLTIVSSLPSRGTTAAETKGITDAIRLAISQRAGSAGGIRVVYEPLEGGDDETGDWSRRREIDNATQAAADPSVVAYIGPYTSGAAMVSLPITNKAGLLEASPSVTWPGLTLAGWDQGEPNKYFPTGKRTFVRMMPPDSAQADAAVQWASALGLNRVVLLDDGSSYSSGLANEFAASAPKAGIAIGDRRTLDLKDLGGLERQLGVTAAIFYAPSSSSSASSVAEALAGSGTPVFATDTALNPQFVDQAGTAASSWHIVSNSSQPDGSGRYAAAGSVTQVLPSQFAANAYELTNLILDAIATGTGRDRAGLTAYLFNATRLRGGVKQRLFTSAGDPAYWLLTGYTVVNGKFTFSRSFSSSP
jgi:branched-chain amino acid transport system substrate-binding protein